MSLVFHLEIRRGHTDNGFRDDNCIFSCYGYDYALAEDLMAVPYKALPGTSLRTLYLPCVALL